MKKDENILKKNFWKYKIFLTFFLKLKNNKKMAVKKKFLLKNVL